MTIRTAAPADALHLLPLLAQLGYTKLNRTGVEGKIKEYSKPEYKLMVCEHNGRIEGFIALHIFEIFHSPGCAGRITAFCVNESVRGQGLGTTLLREAEKYFTEHKCNIVEVTSNNRRTETHEFYIRRGYTNSSLKFVKLLT